MKQLKITVLSVFSFILVLACFMQITVSGLISTSTGYRYSDEFSKTLSNYADLSRISRKGVAPVPGLECTNVSGSACDCMTPQGICVTEDYILITAYCRIENYKKELEENLSEGDNKIKSENESEHERHNSVIYVLSKTTGNYITTIVLPDKNHVGGIAYDGKYVWIAKSEDNEFSAIEISAITNIIAENTDSNTISYYTSVSCGCKASFVIFFDKRLWVGVCNKSEEGDGVLQGFTISGDTKDTLALSPSKELAIPSNANGAAFTQIDGKTCLAVNASYGRNNDTVTHLYTVDLNPESDISVYTDYGEYVLPPMAEEICIDGNNVYTIFESASTAYSQVDGKKCNNIVDRVCIGDITDWFYWTASDYQDEEETIVPPETPSGKSYELTSASDAKYVPTFVSTTSSSKTQTLYNPYTVAMAREISTVAYKISTDDSWSDALSKYGNTQIKRVENNGVYSLGSYKTEEGTYQNIFTSVNATLGLKKVIYNGQTKYVITVAFRGTDLTDFADVWSDINILKNSDGLHSGFADIAEDFYNTCSKIFFTVGGKDISLSDIFEEMKTENSKYCMVVTGHSLGGAVADILVGYNLYNEGVHPSNVVAYTFAAARSASYDYYYPYTNIFNIINSDDWVPTVGNDKQIGTNIIYTPDDSFRKANYGSNFEEGHTSDWWINIYDSLKTGFVAHKLNTVYDAIIKEIASDVSNYCPYNTTSDNNWSDNIIFNQNCFGKINGNLTAYSGISFNEGYLEVSGNCNFYGNDYCTMKNEKDYLLVHGDFRIGAYGRFSAGTIEVKGDFTQSNGYDKYYSSGAHKTILSSESTQTVSFENVSDSYIENLILSNTDINFATPIPNLTLNQDTDLQNTETLNVCRTLDLNGYDLKVYGDLTASGFFTNGGNFSVDGDMNVDSPDIANSTGTVKGNFTAYAVKLENSLMNVGGNLTAYSGISFNEGYLEVSGNCDFYGYDYCTMKNEKDYLLVHGDFRIGAYGRFSAGTIEVKGDFTQSNGYDKYYSSGAHKTILSSESTQTVSFENVSDSYIENLILSNTDINFATPIPNLTLNQDTDLQNTETLNVCRTLDLNGYDLKVYGDLTASGFFTNGGNFSVDGDMNVDSPDIANSTGTVKGNFTAYAVKLENSLINVGGNLETHYSYYGGFDFENSRLEVNGNCSIYECCMNNENDYLLVNGNFTITRGYFNAGTIEVKGDFIQSDSSYKYCSTELHKTILSGESVQTVSFANYSYSELATLILQNSSEEGVIFDSPVKVTILFNHNQNNFTLYDNGTNSSFADYDGDGITDNVDPYPIDSTVFSAKDFVIMPVNKQVFSGEQSCPELTVTYNGSVLVQDRDYTVAYYNNNKPGTATVTVTGINHFKDSTDATFEIYCEHEYHTKDGELLCKYCNEQFDESKLAVGDVNYDGIVNIKDVTSIQKYLADIISYVDIQKKVADVNRDGVINMFDATELQKSIINLSSLLNEKS
ncbi:MAG: dockerin type I domain-containing protein [Ruminococcus sp.]